jgi:hypothetical protein
MGSGGRWREKIPHRNKLATVGRLLRDVIERVTAEVFEGYEKRVSPKNVTGTVLMRPQ